MKMKTSSLLRKTFWLLLTVFLVLAQLVYAVELTVEELQAMPTVSITYYVAEGGEAFVLDAVPTLNSLGKAYWAMLPSEAFTFPMTLNITASETAPYTFSPANGETLITDVTTVDYDGTFTLITAFQNDVIVDTYQLYISTVEMPLIVEPTVEPSAEPTAVLAAVPIVEPTLEPIVEPAAPIVEPTIEPTAEPTVEPTAMPTVAPTAEPTAVPTVVPTADPTTEPTAEPTSTTVVTPTPTLGLPADISAMYTDYIVIDASAMTNTSGVRFRSVASTASSDTILYQVDPGTAVWVHGMFIAEDTQWAYIRYNNSDCFVWFSLITMDEPQVIPLLSSAVAAVQADFGETYFNLRFNQGYAVYTGPGTNYYRADGNAYYGGGVSRYYGTAPNGWLMIGYQTSSNMWRMGYIEPGAAAQIKTDPVDYSLFNITFTSIANYTAKDTYITDDPLFGDKTPLTSLNAGQMVTVLGRYNNYWVYIEVSKSGMQPMRGYIQGDALTTTVPSVTPTYLPTYTPTSTPIPPPSIRPSELPTASPTVTYPVIDLYVGFAVTTSQVALRNDATFMDSAILRTLAANTLLYLNGQVDVSGTVWTGAQTYLGESIIGLLPYASVRTISPGEAQMYIDAYNAANAPTPIPTPSPTRTPAQQSGYFLTLGDNVPMHNVPGSQSSISAWIAEGQVVYVNGQVYYEGFGWDVSNYNSLSGYIRQDRLRPMTAQEISLYLSQTAPTSTPAQTAAPYDPYAMSSYGYVTSNTVNLRQTPDGTSIGVLNQYAFGLVLSSQYVNGSMWYNVNQGGIVGWISGNYFNVLNLSELSTFLNSSEYLQGIMNPSLSASSSSTLSSLTHNCPNTGIMLPEEFNPNVYTYLLTMASWVSQVTFIPVSVDPYATIEVNGVQTSSGQTSQIFDMTDEPQAVTISVTSTSLEETVYRIFLQRRPSAEQTKAFAGYLREIRMDNGKTYLVMDQVKVPYANGNVVGFPNDAIIDHFIYPVTDEGVFYYGPRENLIRANDLDDFIAHVTPGSNEQYQIVYIEDEIVIVLAFVYEGTAYEDAAALYSLGLKYYFGDGITQDYIQAAACFIQASQQGFAQAQYSLGQMYRKGLGVTQDDDQAAIWYHKAAEQGLANAQKSLAEMYLYGQGVTQDTEQAFTWMQKAAEQGLADAQYNLGVMYENGLGIALNYGQAIASYQKAAEQGYVEAQYNLGVMYQNGIGVAQDYGQAAAWYQEAAEQGFASAQNNIGVMYDNGLGIAQDYGQAFVWYQKAAEQGYAGAQQNLAILYYNGFGVTQDYQQAFEWVRKAAEQGFAQSQYFLGQLYENGIGVDKDINQAVAWYELAAQQGDEMALERLESME